MKITADGSGIILVLKRHLEMARTYRKSQSQQQQQQNRVVRQRVREALNSVGKTSPAEVRAIVVSVVENLTRPRAPKELHSVRRTVICRAMDRDCKHSPKFNTDPEEPEWEEDWRVW